jgi:hypothetical protein
MTDLDRALTTLARANAIELKCIDPKADCYYVLDTNKAEPDVNWPGENLSPAVPFDEAKAIHNKARADILLAFAAERAGVGEESPKDRALRLVRELVMDLETWEPELLEVLRLTPQAGLLREWMAKPSAPPIPATCGGEASIASMAQFLCDRLDNLDFSRDMDDFANDYSGHVDPALWRLKHALAALSPTPVAGGGE